MIRLYYADVNTIPTSQIVEWGLTLPHSEQVKIAAYQSEVDRYSRVVALKLLERLIGDFGMTDSLSLDAIKRTDANRPYLESLFDFNIAHSGNMVVCAATTVGKVGVDIVAQSQIDMETVQSVCTPLELILLSQVQNPIIAAANIWSAKEAIVKASGDGVYADWSMIDTRNIEGINLMDLIDGYSLCVVGGSRVIAIDFVGCVEILCT